jgi:hypothetical protein
MVRPFVIAQPDLTEITAKSTHVKERSVITAIVKYWMEHHIVIAMMDGKVMIVLHPMTTR